MRILSLVSILFLLFSAIPDAGAQLFGRKSVDEQREEVVAMREETLERLYREKPSAEKLISGAVG